jgi:hypothetical protein
MPDTDPAIIIPVVELNPKEKGQIDGFEFQGELPKCPYEYGTDDWINYTAGLIMGIGDNIKSKSRMNARYPNATK